MHLPADLSLIYGLFYLFFESFPLIFVEVSRSTDGNAVVLISRCTDSLRRSSVSRSSAFLSARSSQSQCYSEHLYPYCDQY